jgi:hypothetical protein
LTSSAGKNQRLHLGRRRPLREEDESLFVGLLKVEAA